MDNVSNNNSLVVSSSTVHTNPNANPPPAPQVPPHAPSSEPDERAAADRVHADLLLVPDDQTDPVNLDVAAVVGRVVWACTAMAPYANAIAAMPGMDVARLRKLSDFARALAYWQQRARISVAMPENVVAMVQEGMALRERTLRDLQAHVRHGHLEAAQLEAFGGTLSQRKVGEDLEAFSILVHENWSRLEGHTLLTLEAMDEAYRLGARIIDACAARDLAPATIANATLMRDKAYTLVLRTYNEARTAMQYLRRAEDDVEKIVPSLYTTRRAGKRAADEGADAEDAGVDASANAGGASSNGASAAANAAGASMLVPSTPKVAG